MLYLSYTYSHLDDIRYKTSHGKTSQGLEEAAVWMSSEGHCKRNDKVKLN
jgi:hypothetical protein